MDTEQRRAYQASYYKERRAQCREWQQENTKLRAENERIKEQFRTLTGRRPVPGEEQPSGLMVRVAQLILDLQAWYDKLAADQARPAE